MLNFQNLQIIVDILYTFSRLDREMLVPEFTICPNARGSCPAAAKEEVDDEEEFASRQLLGPFEVDAMIVTVWRCQKPRR